MSELKNTTSLIYIAKNEQWSLLNICLNHPQYYNFQEEDEEKNTILHILVQRNHSKFHSQLIDKLQNFIDVNVRNKCGMTPLHVAINSEDNQETKVEVVKDILKLNQLNQLKSVNVLDKFGHSPLYYATIRGNIKIIQLLHACGCDLGHKDNKGENVLHLCARLNYKNLILFFLTKINKESTKNYDDLHKNNKIHPRNNKNLPKINETNSCGQTPLEIAIENSNSNIALVLIQEYQANTKICSSKEGSLLHLAIKMNDRDVTAALLKTIDLNLTLDFESRTPLHCAVEANLPKMVKLLLLKGANVNFPDSDGYTPLHVAVQKGFLEILEIFIQNARHHPQVTGVTLKSNPDLTKLSKEQQLINLDKLDYYKTTRNGDNILHLLSASHLEQQDKMNVFYLLRNLSLKKLVVRTNRDFRTPMHFAYQRFCRPLINALVNLGGDCEEVDRFGKRPRDYCVLPGGGRIRVIKKESFGRDKLRRNVQSAVI